jgi:maltose O-acetyltransferase
VICTPLFRHAGKNINIEARAFFGAGSGIDIGDNSSIGVRAEMYGPVTIGRNVMMGPDVLILTGNHTTSRTDIPMLGQGLTLPQRVSIGDDVWIGQRATLLPGVAIGNGSIIGACAVVSRSVPPYSIVVGNPARVVKSRLHHNE